MFAVSDAWNAKFCLALICFGLLARIHLRDMAWKWAICVLFTRFTIATSSYLAFALFFEEIKIFLFNQRSFQPFEMFRNTSFFFKHVALQMLWHWFDVDVANRWPRFTDHLDVEAKKLYLSYSVLNFPYQAQSEKLSLKKRVDRFLSTLCVSKFLLILSLLLKFWKTNLFLM